MKVKKTIEQLEIELNQKYKKHVFNDIKPKLEQDILNYIMQGGQIDGNEYNRILLNVQRISI